VFFGLTYSADRHATGGEPLLQNAATVSCRDVARAATTREISASFNARAGTLPDPKRSTDTVLSDSWVRGPCARPGLPWRPYSFHVRARRATAFWLPVLVGLVLKRPGTVASAIP